MPPNLAGVILRGMYEPLIQGQSVPDGQAAALTRKQTPSLGCFSPNLIYTGCKKRYGTNFRTHSSYLEDKIMLYEHGSGNALFPLKLEISMGSCGGLSSGKT